MAISEIVCGVSTGADLTASVNALVGNYGTTRKQLKAKLQAGVLPLTVTVQGDSTGNADNEFVVVSMEDIASRYPAYNLAISLWEETGDYYTPHKYYQLGTNGEGYTPMVNGTSGDLTINNSAGALDLTDDLDVRIKVNIPDYSANGEGILLGAFVGGDRSWAFILDSANRLGLWWSEDGSVLLGPVSATDTVAVAATEGTDVYFRCTMDVDNGAGGYDLSFYYSTDEGVNWIQVGTTIVGGSTTSFFTHASGVKINGRGITQWTGKFFRAEIADGIDGPIIASPNNAMNGILEENLNVNDLQGNLIQGTSNTPSPAGAPTIFVLNASTGGKALNYSSDVTRFAQQTPFATEIAIINYAHNQGGPADYYDTYADFVEQILTKYRNTTVIPSTQNPKISPATALQINRQDYLNGIIAQVASAKNLNLIDAYGAFVNADDPAANSDPDGTHPTPAGSVLWADQVISVLGV